jgi:hypothetical protein
MEKMTNLKAIEYVVANVELPADVEERIIAIRNSLAKKSATKSKASIEQAKANESIMTEIKTVLLEYNEPMTASQINKANDTLSVYSNQKISALLRKMCESGAVIRETAEKPKRTVFTAVATD